MLISPLSASLEIGGNLINLCHDPNRGLIFGIEFDRFKNFRLACASMLHRHGTNHWFGDG